jgi:hypothetical protein
MVDATAPVERAPAIEPTTPQVPSSSQAPARTTHGSDLYLDDDKGDSKGELSDDEFMEKERNHRI